MEAVPRLHMLWFALKTSPEGTSFSTLKKHIAESYQENPESFSKEVYTLETLRNVAMRPEKDMEGCAVLKRYYCQLHSLSNRFPQISKRNLFTFIWKDLYINNINEITDIRFEMAAVLFNIGALHSQVGASVSRSDIDGMKLACTHFQCAAWAFGELKNKYEGINNNNDFMTPELLMFMQQVSFAQAQECILEKSLIDNRKPAIVAKVTAQIINYYNTALVALLVDGDDSAVSQVVDSGVYKLWKKYLKFKIFYLNCILYLYQGQQAEEQRKMGERLVLYQAAWDKLEEAQKESKGLPDQKEIIESLSFTADVVEGKRKNAKNENEFIYHDPLPELSNIPAVQGANLVNGIGFSVTDPEVAGVDIFSRLIPMEAHEASSLYSEEKAQILRVYGSKIEEKDNELNSYMSSLNIEHLNVSEEKANKIPQGIVDRCASINSKTNAIPDLIQSMSNLAEICADVETNLKEIKNILDEEDMKEKHYQQTSGVHRSNAHFTEMTREFQKYLEAHQKAGDSNDTLRRAMELHINNLRILSRPLKEIQSSVPKLTGEMNEESFKELKLLLNKVNEMKAQRAQFHADLRINVNDDDITRKVIANGGDDIKELFKKELAKHDHIKKLIDQNLIAQGNILTALTETYAKCAAALKLIADVSHKKENFFSSLAASYDVYEDLLAKSAKGLEFYKKLQGNIQKLLTRVRAAKDVQDEDRQQRLKNIVKPQENITNSIVSSSTGPKLKDYLKGGSRNESSSKYIPTVRPNPLGSENPTAALCTVPPSQISNYAYPQVSGSGMSDMPAHHMGNVTTTNPHYYDANGYLNPIYQNTTGICDQPATNLNAPPPSYSTTTMNFQYLPSGQQNMNTMDNQILPQQNDNIGYNQQVLHNSSTLNKTSSNYSLQNYNQTSVPTPAATTTIPKSQPYNNTMGYYAPHSNNDNTALYSNYQQQTTASYPQTQTISSSQNYLNSLDTNPMLQQQQSMAPAIPNSISSPLTQNPQILPSPLMNDMENLNLNSNQIMSTQLNQQTNSSYYAASFPQNQYLPDSQYSPLNYQTQSNVPVQETLPGQQMLPTDSTQNNSMTRQLQSGYNYGQTNNEYQYLNNYPSSSVPSVPVLNAPDNNNETAYYATNAINQQQQQATPQSSDPNIVHAYFEKQFGFQLPKLENNQLDKMNNLPTPNSTTIPGSSNSMSVTYSQINFQQLNNVDNIDQQNIQPHSQFIIQQPQLTQTIPQNTIQHQTIQPPHEIHPQPQPQQAIQQPQEIRPTTQQPVQIQQNSTLPQKYSASSITSSNIDLLCDIDFTGSPVKISTPPLQPVITPRKSSLSESSQISLNGQSGLNTSSDPNQLTENKTVLKHQEQLPSQQIQTSKNQPEISATEAILTDRKSSCDNLSICSDLSSLDHSFDWDSISIRDEQKPINNSSNGNMNEKLNMKKLLRDPFDDDKILKYFHKEVERYEKMIETMNIKMLNGNTLLANKWKELQDLLVKDESKRITAIGKLFPEKNRSADCLPYDHARVVLKRSTDDYINAAYVKDLGPGCPNFILAQTPLQNTVNDFWSMIWTQKARTVVCLHTPNEILDTFWPQDCNKEMHFDDFSVTLVKQFDLSHCTELNLKLTMNGADAILDLSLLQIKAWSKNLAPQILGIAQNILVAYKQRCQEFKTNSPLIMNCLTGSERSGLVALAICSILSTQSRRPALTNVVDVWYRICSQRKSALRDTNNLEYSMKIVLCHGHDVLNKRGIMTSYQMKNAQRVTSVANEEIKDPLNDLDPLWKLKK